MRLMMDSKEGRAYNSYNKITQRTTDDEMEGLRRGPWTLEEDLSLINHIAKHGEGRWNSLARRAGLRRTGKSCRLRWLNYLRPDVKRGNITLEEQLMILELHSRWGNRWSKIVQHLPGRTDNEIKNYWRTKVQKHAKQLKCDVNSKKFKDTMRYLWMPRLVERIQAATTASTAAAADTKTITSFPRQPIPPQPLRVGGCTSHVQMMTPNYTYENSSNGASSDSIGTQVSSVSEGADQYYNVPVSDNSNTNQDYLQGGIQMGYGDDMNCPSGFLFNHGLDEQNNPWMDSWETLNNLWDVEDYLFLQQLNNNCM